MKLYRGQKRGDPVGEWWTSSRDVARDYAIPCGDWEILSFSADRRKLAAHKQFSRTVVNGRRLKIVRDYRIPLAGLRELVIAVRVVEGSVRLDSVHSAALVSEGVSS